MNPFRERIFYKLALVFTGIGIIGLSLTLPYSVHIATEMLNKKVVSHVSVGSRILIHQIETNLKHIPAPRDISEYLIAIEGGNVSKLPSGIQNTFLPFIKSFEIDIAAILDKDKKPVWIYDRGRLAKSLPFPLTTAPPWNGTFQRLKFIKDGFFHFRIHPIYNPYGNIISYVLIGKWIQVDELEWLKDILKMDILFVNLKGTHYVTTIPKTEERDNLKNFLAVSIKEPGRVLKVHQILLNRKPYLLKLSPIFLNNHQTGYAGILIDYASVLKSKNKIVYTILFFYLSGVIVFYMLGYYLIKKTVVTPLSKIIKATDVFSRGQYDTRIELPNQDEIGKLATTFNQMAQHIQENILATQREKQRAEAYLHHLELTNQELKKTRAELIQAGKMVGMGQLGASIAHELNQPLLAIGIFAERCLKTIDKDNPTYSLIEKIITQTDRMNKITNNIRMFSRQSKSEFKPISIAEPIEDALTLVKKQLENHNISLKVEINDSLPRVAADHNQLHQVFLNLITNARDAIDEIGEGKLTIMAKPICDDDFIEVQIKDTGPGIPKDMIGKIFQPFFTTKEEGKGTGLGLSISHEIIKIHNGILQAKNNPEGKGSIFSVILPTENAKPCWEITGCNRCQTNMKRETCPVYKTKKGITCWEILSKKVGNKKSLKPECYQCPVYMRRRKISEFEPL